MIDSLRRRASLRATSIVVAGALVLAFLQAIQFLLEQRANSPSLPMMFLRLLPPWLVLAALTPFVVALSRRWPLSRRSWLPWLVHLVASIAYAVVALIALAVLDNNVGLSNLGVIALTKILFENYLFQDVVIYWGLTAAIQSIETYRQSKEKELRSARLEGTLARVQLQALHGQLQPHFLFNTLNSVVSMARLGKNEEVVTMIARLSDLLRRIITESKLTETELGSELDFVEQYVGLERVRSDHRIDLKIDVAPSHRLYLVPVFLLQPLVENAIRHGLTSAPHDCVICIASRIANNQMWIFVRDNGAGLSEAPTARNGIGTGVTKERLALLYADNASFTLESAEPSGAVCTIRLPLRGTERL